MSAKFVFGRLSDARVLELMDALIATFKRGSATVQIGDLGTIGVKVDEEGTVETGRAEFGSVLREDTYLITLMQWSAGSNAHRVVYQRGKRVTLNPNNNSEQWTPSDNPFIDGIEVTSTADNAPYILGVINRFVNMAPPIASGPEAGSALDQSQAILNRVSSAVATLVEHTAERQKQLDQTRTTLARDAEKAIRAGKAEAAAEVASIEQRFADKEKALASREAELDDRANTHVRREFAKKMAELSDTRLSSNLLDRSKLSFWIPLAIAVIPVLLLSWLIIKELGYITIFNDNIAAIAKDKALNAGQKTLLIGNVNSQVMYAQLRIALQSIGVAALVWFALRLASGRYALVSGWERDLHKFRLDTERAGSLVEGDLEARKVNQEGLPDVLLESFSRNLFAGSDAGHGPGGSEGLGGALNALLGQAAKVRVGPDGVNVEVEGKGIRRAKKLIEDGDQ